MRLWLLVGLELWGGIFFTAFVVGALWLAGLIEFVPKDRR